MLTKRDMSIGCSILYIYIYTERESQKKSYNVLVFSSGLEQQQQKYI